MTLVYLIFFKDLKPTQWKIIELEVLNYYLQLEKRAGIHVQNIGIVEQSLEELLYQLKNEQQPNLELWRRRFDGPDLPRTSPELRLFYMIFIYHTVKHYQSYFTHFQEFDPIFQKKVVIFRKVFLVFQKLIGFYRVVSRPDFVIVIEFKRKSRVDRLIDEMKLLPETKALNPNQKATKFLRSLKHGVICCRVLASLSDEQRSEWEKDLNRAQTEARWVISHASTLDQDIRSLQVQSPDLIHWLETGFMATLMPMFENLSSETVSQLVHLGDFVRGVISAPEQKQPPWMALAGVIAKFFKMGLNGIYLL